MKTNFSKRCIYCHTKIDFDLVADIGKQAKRISCRHATTSRQDGALVQSMLNGSCIDFMRNRLNKGTIESFISCDHLLGRDYLLSRL